MSRKYLISSYMDAMHLSQRYRDENNGAMCNAWFSIACKLYERILWS